MLETVGLFLVVQISFFVGYAIGRLSPQSSKANKKAEDEFCLEEFETKIPRKPPGKTKIQIDSGVFVTDANDSSLESKGSNLGQQIIVEDDVSASASKLAMLKRKK
jgi:hypothetical protein